MEKFIFIGQALLVSHFLAALGGYYLGHRGIVGVKSDLQDVKKDVENIAGKVQQNTNQSA